MHFRIKSTLGQLKLLYKKDLHDPDNHDGVITHLEPDILECKLKWALESITANKLVEVMEFQWSYFKSWKMMLLKCCTQYASKFGKLSSGHRTGKGQFSFQSQRKAMTNLDSILKSRDITLPTKVCLVKAMVLTVVMYGCESWDAWNVLKQTVVGLPWQP